MEAAWRFVIIAGVVLVVAGAAMWGAARLGLGRLPGDILVERDGFRFAFPIVTSIVLSIILTIVLNVAVRIFR